MAVIICADITPACFKNEKLLSRDHFDLQAQNSSFALCKKMTQVIFAADLCQ
ncbi:hypothetical protein [Pontibacter cellulosilyticus]|uniref:Uncharacterized protein n=1 Tax=Pontibacter cellulosilyticus TaxID=1720253 RepID=A0A923N523_9BACT|nr:hypothetical protein [Pontibacter cellulosilyticus]MBC5992299.1 hypothetical protein [Pontibacter cellulosilyticus]